MKTLFLALFLALAMALPSSAQLEGNVLGVAGGSGGAGGDADTLGGLSSGDYLQGGVCNNTVAVCTDVATRDYQCAANTTCGFGAAGTGVTTFYSGAGRIDFANGSDIVRMSLFLGDSNSYHLSMSDGPSALQTNVNGIAIGRRTDVGATDLAASVAESMSSDMSRQDIHEFFGAGLIGNRRPQTCDCGTAGTPNTPNTVTCDVQSNIIFLIDGDADSCTVTLATTSIDTLVTNFGSSGRLEFGEIQIVVDSVGGGGTFDLADQAGILDVAATRNLGVKDSVGLRYSSFTPDELQEKWFSNL